MTKSPFLKTVLVAVAFLALLLYVVLVESRRPSSEEEQKKKDKVFSFDRTKVKELSLVRKDGETIRLAKDAGGWKMTSPAAVAADPAEVETLLSTLGSLETGEVVAETGGKPAEYGLEPARVTVTVVVDGVQEPLALAIGDKVPALGGVYAKHPAQPKIFTLPPYAEGSFDRKPFDLRDRNLLHVPRDAVLSIEVTGPEGGYALVKEDKGQRLVEPALALLRNAGWFDLPGPAEQWVFTRPVSTLAARWSVDGLLGSLESLRVDSVAAEEAKDLKPFGLDKPVRRVVVGLADGTAKTLEIGASTAERKHYARDASRPLVGVIPGALVDDLAKGMGGLRAKRLLELRVYDAREFEVEAGGGKRAYLRSEQAGAQGQKAHQWKRTAPDAKELDTQRVEDALFSLAGVDVLEFVDRPAGLEAYGLASPALKVVLRLGPGQGTAAFELGKKDGAVYARRSGDAALLKVDPAQADKVLAAFREIESPPPSPSPSPASPAPGH